MSRECLEGNANPAWEVLAMITTATSMRVTRNSADRFVE
jgi:hypothetical protein